MNTYIYVMLRVLHGSGLEPATLSTVDPCFGIYRLSMTDFNSLSLAVSKASSDNGVLPLMTILSAALHFSI